MPAQNRKVAYGYLPNFKGDSVVLFVGDGRALQEFATYLDELAKAPINVTTMLNSESVFLPKRGIRITVTVADAPVGMRRIASDSAEPRFEWRISRNLAAKFAELTRAVASMDRPSHQYLDADAGDDVTVIVSNGEYDEAWLRNDT